MRTAYKFLAPGGVSPFTGFRWPGAGTWVSAPDEREEHWIFACRDRDLPYWLDEELWRVELDAPVREARYQIASPRAVEWSDFGSGFLRFSRGIGRKLLPCVVSFRNCVPSASIVQIWFPPSRLEEKAKWRPSGAQTGFSLRPAPCVNCTNWRVATSIKKML